MNRMREEGWVSFVLVGMIALGILLWLVVDHGLMTRRSEHFSEKAFREVAPGWLLSEAATVLGEPVCSEIFEPSQSDPEPHAAYYFSCAANDWWPIYTQAWVVTDRNERIIRVGLTNEP